MYGSKTNANQRDQDLSDVSDVLFLPELLVLANKKSARMQLESFLTGSAICYPFSSPNEQNKQIAKPRDAALRTWNCRITLSHIRRVLDDHDDKYVDRADSKNTIVYVCGPQGKYKFVNNFPVGNAQP